MSTSSDTPDAQSSVISATAETLAFRMLEAFWCLNSSTLTITSPDRMRAVLRALADEIETWAPPVTETKICHLAVIGVAQRLRMEADL